jgi:hypothetical protein
VKGPALVRCYLDEELRRGLEAVLQQGRRCVICGEEDGDAHDAQIHGFQAPDVLTVFLEAVQRREDRTEARW